MSAQFGHWAFDSHPLGDNDLDELDRILAPYGPDGRGTYRKGGLSSLFRSFKTTKEQALEHQPVATEQGLVMMWDGRLDNRTELTELLRCTTSPHSDLALVARAYERWGSGCFAKLLGDWAVSIWNEKDQSLTLAKDFAGGRHLFYQIEKARVRWCTLLEPLVRFRSSPLTLNREYLAGWLSLFPAADLSPYAEIRSVPPSSFITIKNSGVRTQCYWEFNPAKQIVYRTDEEYEERFRFLFSQSVARRLRCESPVLAELSGGIDSSAIVCIADELLKLGLSSTPRLDTVSYFDNSEPNWNEKQFFSIVEKKRGREGCHIDFAKEQPFLFSTGVSEFAAAPASGPRPKKAREYSTSVGHRVLLSGLGGDEVLGGVPTPTPELADLLASGRWIELTRKLSDWALAKRCPWIHLLSDTVRSFAPPPFGGGEQEVSPPAWLTSEFIRRNRSALHGYQNKTRFYGPRPSFQENLSALRMLQRQISCLPIPTSPLMEKRYPYLDRDLLEFLYAIPRNQLVRPGNRRSLMRRALSTHVPPEILERKRKGFLTRGPLRLLNSSGERIFKLIHDMASARLNIVNPEVLESHLAKSRDGFQVHWVQILRTLALEQWLRSVTAHSVFERSDEFGPSVESILKTEQAASSSLRISAS